MKIIQATKPTDGQGFESCESLQRLITVQDCAVKHVGPSNAPNEQQEISLDLRAAAEDKLGIGLIEEPVAVVASQDVGSEEQHVHENANGKGAVSETELLSPVNRSLNLSNEIGYSSSVNRGDVLATPKDEVEFVDEAQKACHGMIEQDGMTSQHPEVRFTIHVQEPTPKSEPKSTLTASIAPHCSECFDNPMKKTESFQTTAPQDPSPAQQDSPPVTPVRRQPWRECRSHPRYGTLRELLSPESDASEPSPVFSPTSSGSTPMTGESDIGTEPSHYFSKARRPVEEESPLLKKSTRSSRELVPVPAPNFARAKKPTSHARLIKPDPAEVAIEDEAPTTHKDNTTSQDTPLIDTVRHNEIDSNKKDSGPCGDTNTSQLPQVPQLPPYPGADGEFRLSGPERVCRAQLLSAPKDLPPSTQPVATAKAPVKTESEIRIAKSAPLNLELGEYFVQSLQGIQTPETSTSTTSTRRGGFRFTPLKTKKFACDLIYQLAKPVKCRRPGYIYCYSDELTPDHVNIGSAMIPIRYENNYSEPAKIGQPKDDRHLGRRLKSQEKECSLKMVVHFAAYMPCAVRNIESLVHLTLRSDKRRATQCVGGQCQKEHIEWFQTRPEKALAIVKTWQRFSCLIPYRMQGYVENAWENRVGNEERQNNRKKETRDWFDEHMEVHVEQLVAHQKKGLPKVVEDIEQDKQETLPEKGKVWENIWWESLSNSSISSLKVVLSRGFCL
ncbi:uncharacterized protein F5Z01DRAFT_109415 [Emericellopsis atlantica]|uniref:Bacteriophage T5 Orf172 DNA-binding domain-containing protein n=1 Tax=Emericellopsis atlantica TaxID=2614577 RepID=A0A9P7ZM91_9HYPO|nr:uncharacterized protein F5Z01DRAFT_109415 [Emericellopsis atlantica]KAG9254531.1 hypothetical protein F5Z01DRAFT_109415 [Emericellopsis atlantica]